MLQEREDAADILLGNGKHKTILSDLRKHKDPTMEIKDFLNQAWRDHATQSEAVAQRLSTGLALITGEGQAAQLAALGVHVLGEHLGRWQDARAFLTELSSRSEAALDKRAIARSRASIEYCCESAEAFENALAAAQDESLPKDSPRIRALAVAASACAAQGKTALAMRAFDEALAAAAYKPDAKDPAAQSLAMTGNNLACELEERSTRSPQETELMLRAATIAREYWAIAGGWLETERAEYRLARSHVAAGLGAQALEHARACLTICEQNKAEAFELFFAWEATIWAAVAAKDGEAAKNARSQAEALISVLDPQDQSYARSCLEKAPRLED